VIVAKDEKDLETLEILKERGRLNGVKVEVVDERELRKVEPLAKTSGYALYVESTANRY